MDILRSSLGCGILAHKFFLVGQICAVGQSGAGKEIIPKAVSRSRPETKDFCFITLLDPCNSDF